MRALSSIRKKNWHPISHFTNSGAPECKRCAPILENKRTETETHGNASQPHLGDFLQQESAHAYCVRQGMGRRISPETRPAMLGDGEMKRFPTNPN